MVKERLPLLLTVSTVYKNFVLFSLFGRNGDGFFFTYGERTCPEQLVLLAPLWRWNEVEEKLSEAKSRFPAGLERSGNPVSAGLLQIPV